MKSSLPPYELNQGHTTEAFVAFEDPNGTRKSYRWNSIQSISLNAEKTRLIIEFARLSIEIMGSNLTLVEAEARRERLNVVRAGSDSSVTIDRMLTVGLT